MRGDELRVVDAFVAWLESEGWVVRREVEFVDIMATRDGETLYAEAKGADGRDGARRRHNVRAAIAANA